MYSTPNIVSVLGKNKNAIDVVFRKIFKYNTCPGTIIIIDYNGRGALALSELNKMSLLKKKIYWFDTSDRRHTLKMLMVNNSPHIKTILLRLINLILRLGNTQISDSTIEWIIKTCIRYSENGSLNMLTIFKILSVTELRKNYIKDIINQDEIASFTKLLEWALRYPAVFALSDGINSINLENYFERKSVIWIESFAEHLEQTEHLIVSGLIDITIENSLKNFQLHNPNLSLEFTVIHLYPPQHSFPNIPGWITEKIKNVRHISIHNFQPQKPINAITRQWVESSENIWIAGETGKINRSAHKLWLNELEMNQIENLGNGKVWIKTNKAGKSITVNVKMFEGPIKLSQTFRTLSNKNRKLTSILQLSTGIDTFSNKFTGITGIYNKLCNIEILRQGWYRVKKGKKDSHGIDKVKIKDFNNNVEKELLELQDELCRKTYQCRPLRRIFLTKPEGGIREIGIACIRDRVVQTSCLILLEPFFEPYFSNYSFAYRPRRDAHQAITLVRSRIKTGLSWTVIADIKKCFDSIDHNVLLDLIEKKISDIDLLNLIKHWLYVDILEFNELLPSIMGVPQGESLSPLLSNIYLDSLDKHFESQGYRFVRYADDIIIQTNSQEEAEEALLLLSNFLAEPLHLEIKPAKTNFTNSETGFEFLGFRISNDSIRIRDKKILLVKEEIEKQILKMGSNSSNFSEKAVSLIKINAMVRGFRNYFMLPDERVIKNQLEQLDAELDNMGRVNLTPEIKDDPGWLCHERFYEPLNINDIESYEEESLRKTKTEQEYPEENIYNTVPQELIKDNSVEKSTMLIHNFDDNEPGENIRDSIYESGKRLYVMTHGSYLSLDGNMIIIKKRKQIIAKYNLNNIGLVYLQGLGINISVDMQLKLAELEIPIVFSPPVGNPIAVVSPVTSSRSRLRRLQVIRREDTDMITTGLNMLSAKVVNQASLIKYFSKYRKRKESTMVFQMRDVANNIKEISDKIKSLNPTAEEIRSTAMGCEGHAASLYWQNIKLLIPSGFNFLGRITQGAKDSVNQCFNYVYGILYGEVWRAVVKTGLDPYFGIIHGSQRDGGSLIFDIIEEFRSPFADRIVISMLGRGFIPEINKDGLLRTRSKRMLAKSFSKRWNNKIKWRSRELSPSEILEFQTKSISRLLNNEGNYFPFRMKW